MKNLSYKLSEDELQDAFDGSSSARIATFQDTGRSRGFGFVEFNNIEDAELALDRMQGQELDGREIYVDFASESRDGGGSGGGGFRRGKSYHTYLNVSYCDRYYLTPIMYPCTQSACKILWSKCKCE